MKWGKFKKIVNKQINDNDEIWYIDITFDNELIINKDDLVGAYIYN